MRVVPHRSSAAATATATARNAAAAPAARRAAGPRQVALTAVQRMRHRQLARAFHSWWLLWEPAHCRRQAASAALHRQRWMVFSAFRAWARKQLAQRDAWELFRASDRPLPPAPSDGFLGGGEMGAPVGGWISLETTGEETSRLLPAPRWMRSWSDVKKRLRTMQAVGRAEAVSQERRGARARHAEALRAAAAAGSWSGGRGQSRGGGGGGVSESLVWMDSVLGAGDPLCGEWLAQGQYVGGKEVEESFMLRRETTQGGGSSYTGYGPLPRLVPAGQRSSSPLEPSVLPEALDQFVLEDFTVTPSTRAAKKGVVGKPIQSRQVSVRGDERLSFVQVFPNGDTTTWKCTVCADPAAEGGLVLRAGQWWAGRAPGLGRLLGTFIASSGPRGRVPGLSGVALPPPTLTLTAGAGALETQAEQLIGHELSALRTEMDDFQRQRREWQGKVVRELASEAPRPRHPRTATAAVSAAAAAVAARRDAGPPLWGGSSSDEEWAAESPRARGAAGRRAVRRWQEVDPARRGDAERTQTGRGIVSSPGAESSQLAGCTRAEQRELQELAEAVFERYVGVEGAAARGGCLSSERYVVVERAVHEGMGLAMVDADARAEFAAELDPSHTGSRGAGWKEWWVFLQRQMHAHQRSVLSMAHYLRTVLETLPPAPEPALVSVGRWPRGTRSPIHAQQQRALDRLREREREQEEEEQEEAHRRRLRDGDDDGDSDCGGGGSFSPRTGFSARSPVGWAAAAEGEFGTRRGHGVDDRSSRSFQHRRSPSEHAVNVASV
jgi:hypothetical protein